MRRNGRESMASTSEIETIPEYRTTGYQTTRVYEKKSGAPLVSKSETKTTVRRGPGGRITTTTTTTNRTTVKDGGKEQGNMLQKGKTVYRAPMQTPRISTSKSNMLMQKKTTVGSNSRGPSAQDYRTPKRARPQTSQQTTAAPSSAAISVNQ